jgi:hypothetical protein
MGVKQRLIEFAKSQERSVRAFEIKVGLTVGYINAIRVSIQPDKLKSIASYYPVLNTEWLLTGEGPMLRDERPVQVPEPTVVYERDPRDIQLITTQEEIIRRDKELVAAKDGIIATKDELIAMLKDRISDLEKGSKSVGLGPARSAAAEATPGTRHIK